MVQSVLCRISNGVGKLPCCMKKKPPWPADGDMTPWMCHPSYTIILRGPMQQSDLDLLHLVPPHHLQALVKSRRLPPSPRIQNIDTTAGPSSIAITEIAQHLFDPATISDALGALDEREYLTLRELVLCGGRANSRDLALYLAHSGLLGHGKKAEIDPMPVSHSGQITPEHSPGAPQYPVPHPHGVFELAVRHLLLLGLLFWGKQTNFGGREYAS